MLINRDHEKLQKILKRGDFFEEHYLNDVKEIVDAVRTHGDAALAEYTLKFDKFDILAKGMEISPEEIEDAYKSLDPKLVAALERAAGRIRRFHEKQTEKTWYYEEDDILLGQKISPLEKVGVYVPGGKAAYPSSVLMNIIPAKVAGVSEIIMLTPTPEGKVNKAVLAAAKIAGANRVFRVGGAQAVAALALGTQSIPKVDKIVGPGNIYVALAKKMMYGTVDIDMIAGPSEVLVIADNSANAVWVAADMLSQAEHDEMASAVLVTTSRDIAKSVEAELKIQVKRLERREIAEKSLKNFGAIIMAEDLEEACAIANDIAPEHLELCVSAPMEALKYIRHAGAVFMGNYTPEAAGDYFAGPNHVLPTGGTARFFSPLGVYDFIKRTSLIYYSKSSIAEHSADIAAIADAEGLDGHAKSARYRGSK